MDKSHLRRCLVSIFCTGLLVAGLVPGASEASPRPSDPRAATTRVRSVNLRTTTKALPSSQPKTGGGGALNLTEEGKLQRLANRSNSPRPQVVVSADGRRRMASTTTAPSWLPEVAPTPVSTTRTGTRKGWEGLNEFDNQKYNGYNVEPPDQGFCAGNGRVLELINDTVRVYDTEGANKRTLTLNAFLGEPDVEFATDPSCVWDAGSRRFFALSLILDVNPATGDLTGQTWLDVAASKSASPLGGWNIYKIDTTDNGTAGTPAHKDCPCLGDFPHLATDAHGVFLTTNEYPFAGNGSFGNGFNGAQIYALSKAQLTAGATRLRVVQLENVRVPSASGPTRVGFTLWPAQTIGTGYPRESHGTMYFVSSFAAEEARPDDFTGHASDIGIWWIGNTASLDATPQLDLQVRTVAVGSYGIPPLSNQKQGPLPLRDCLTVQCVPKLSDPYTPEQPGTLDSSDSRILTAVYRDGIVLTALDTAMQVSGNVQAGFQWFALRAHGTSSGLDRQGYTGVARGNVVYPAIVTNPTGRGYVGYTLTGDSWYPSAAYSFWSGTRPRKAVHLAAAGAAPDDGLSQYLAFNGGGTDPVPTIRPRWGDYSAAAWDGQRFYLANEYIAHSCSYAQFATDFTCGGKRTFYGNFSTHVQQLS
jgi:hypothetical protein